MDGTVDPGCSMDGQAVLHYYEIMDINKASARRGGKSARAHKARGHCA